MRKINHYVVEHGDDELKAEHSDSFLFHKSVLEAKNSRSSELKKRVDAIEKGIESRFDLYDEKFSDDKLEDIQEDKVMLANKDDLNALYSWNAKVFVGLLEHLMMANTVLNDTCPNCDKDSIESFDHLLPQSKYPEYSDHPLNLMPCCFSCNGKKSANWLESGKRKYLNLYLDEIPDIQFLYCDLSLADDTIVCKFSLDNCNGIDADLYRRIKNHFTDLKLLVRYENRANGIISDFKTTLKRGKRRVLKGKATKEKIREEMKDESDDMKEEQGVNSWRALIYEACCNNEDVFEFVYDSINV